MSLEQKVRALIARVASRSECPSWDEAASLVLLLSELDKSVWQALLRDFFEPLARATALALHCHSESRAYFLCSIPILSRLDAEGDSEAVQALMLALPESTRLLVGRFLGRDSQSQLVSEFSNQGYRDLARAYWGGMATKSDLDRALELLSDVELYVMIRTVGADNPWFAKRAVSRIQDVGVLKAISEHCRDAHPEAAEEAYRRYERFRGQSKALAERAKRDLDWLEAKLARAAMYGPQTDGLNRRQGLTTG